MSEKKESNTTVRRRRVPLGAPRRKLAIETGLVSEGKVPRWINEDRISFAEEGGYTFVEGKLESTDPDIKNETTGLGSRISKPVGKRQDGSPMYAYLMEIDRETYEEDQAAKQADIDELEDALRAGRDEHGTVGRDGRYLPKEKIKIENK